MTRIRRALAVVVVPFAIGLMPGLHHATRAATTLEESLTDIRKDLDAAKERLDKLDDQKLDTVLDQVDCVLRLKATTDADDCRFRCHCLDPRACSTSQLCCKMEFEDAACGDYCRQHYECRPEIKWFHPELPTSGSTPPIKTPPSSVPPP